MGNFLSDFNFSSYATMRITKRLWHLILRPLVALMLCAAFFSGSEKAARAEPTSEAKNTEREYKIKAAFLYKFAKFTKWPEDAFHDASAPLRVCVLGHIPFPEALDSIAGKRVSSRQIAISSLGQVEQADSCHVVFISASEATNLRAILAHLSQRPVLTISDMRGFATEGGMITLKTVNNKIRFTVNVIATRNGALSLSPQVLRLADIVHRVATADQKTRSRANSKDN